MQSSAHGWLIYERGAKAPFSVFGIDNNLLKSWAELCTAERETMTIELTTTELRWLNGAITKEIFAETRIQKELPENSPAWNLEELKIDNLTSVKAKLEKAVSGNSKIIRIKR